MTDSNTTRQWVLQRQNFNLVMKCKKAIRAEFDVELCLDQGDLLEQIRYFGGRTNLPELHQLIALLFNRYEQDFGRPSGIHTTAETAKSPPSRTKSVRMYRGQVVKDPAPAGVVASSEQQRSKVLYRGRSLA